MHPLRDQYTALVGPITFTRIFMIALLGAFLDALRKFDTRALFSPATLRDRGFARGLSSLTQGFKDFEDSVGVPAIVASAYGRVLELGPGVGNQCDRFDKSRVSHIYGVEPNIDMIPELREEAHRAGLVDQYTIVPCGMEDFDALAKAGIVDGSFDTVLSVQVLCTVPEPQKVIEKLYKLLKPGGTLIVWEHVQCSDPLHRAIQWLWNPFWSFALRGCSLGRPTDKWLVNVGKWDNVQLEWSSENATLCPRIGGYLIKAKE